MTCVRGETALLAEGRADAGQGDCCRAAQQRDLQICSNHAPLMSRKEARLQPCSSSPPGTHILSAMREGPGISALLPLPAAWHSHPIGNVYTTLT